MFGLSFWEIGIICAVALLIFGPSKLPELARSLGKGLREFRKATDDLRSTINEEMHPPEPKPGADPSRAIPAPVTPAEVASVFPKPPENLTMPRGQEISDAQIEGDPKPPAAKPTPASGSAE